MTAALTTYATDKRDNYLSLKEEAQNNFSAADEALALAREDYEELITQAVMLDSDIASAREQLSDSNNMPAEIDALNESLQVLLIDKRHISAELSHAQEMVNAAQVSAELYQYQLAALDKDISAANAEHDQAVALETQHSAWTDNELEDEINTARDAATALLNDSFTPNPDADINPAAILSNATARIDADMPSVLVTLARARAAVESERLQGHQAFQVMVADSVATHQASTTGSGGVLAQQWSVFDNAHNNLKHYALTTVRDYQHAIDLLQVIEQSDELSVSSSAAIAAAALAADADAVTTETALYAARAALQAKELELDTAIVTATVNDINADSMDDGDVQTLQSELEALESQLQTAQDAHTDELAAQLDVWEMTVPDYIWNNLQQYDQARALLTQVSNSDAGSLLTALTDAETALISALENEDSDRRLQGYLDIATQITSQHYDYLTSASATTLLSALRGDG